MGQSWARGHFLASRQRQYDNTMRQRQHNSDKKNIKNVKALVSKCKRSNDNESRHFAIINYVLARRHGHVVAAVLSRAQLCNLGRADGEREGGGGDGPGHQQRRHPRDA